jgi:hypothetical protein
MDKIGGLDARRHEKSAYTFTAYGRYLGRLSDWLR